MLCTLEEVEALTANSFALGLNNPACFLCCPGLSVLSWFSCGFCLSSSLPSQGVWNGKGHHFTVGDPAPGDKDFVGHTE